MDDNTFPELHTLLVTKTAAAISWVAAVLATKTALVVSWVAAGLGLGTPLGWVNPLAGLLSVGWLSVQLFNYFMYTMPVNRANLEALNKSTKELDDAS